jgi:hypothetical protein
MEKNEDSIELPDALTLMKILALACQKRYHHVVLFALLINELGVMSNFL